MVPKNARQEGCPTPLNPPEERPRLTDEPPRLNRPGRPRKVAEEQRTDRLPGVRVTAAERVHVEELAARAGLPVTDFCRRATLGQRVHAPRAGVDETALVALNRIGVNLNQIAHRLNAGGRKPPHLDDVLREVLAAVERVAGRME